MAAGIGDNAEVRDTDPTVVMKSKYEERAVSDPETDDGDWLPSFTRFRIDSLIGCGGMGSVYKAWDDTLERWVAVKVLHSQNPNQIERFSREAKAQARIQHDHVCPVFEVGEEDGQHYIAMALVNGVDLRDAIREMSLEQVVGVFIDVAGALHAAHRSGLIHRDVKPSNIMLEHRDDEGWHAWVMDFGIAREVAGDGKTATGTVLGTPAYMAPEQVSGVRDACDRRTDVYGLGATLYETFTEQPPFDGATGIEILLHVAGDDPQNPRILAPALPTDLETIILKCLEKDPNRRYESARAVAEDLQRFLDGDTILARRADLLYRIRKRIAKHKLVSGFVAFSTLAIVLAAGFSIRTAMQARERAEVAQEFGRRITQIENSLRIAALLPQHDIRPEMKRVRQQLDGIRQDMKDIGGIADGPGAYALGRGNLALNDLQQARKDLERAWDLGYTSPESAYALGLTLGQLYEAELARLRFMSDQDAKAAQLETINKSLRDPALGYLALISGLAPARQAYAQGLIALYEGHFKDAAGRAEKARKLDAGLFEAEILRGRANMEHGASLVESGKFEEANALFEESREALESAVGIARSEPRAHQSRCRLATLVLELKIQQGNATPEFYESADQICSEALEVDPDYLETLVTASRLHWRWATHQISHGQDPSASLDQAIGLAKRATEIEATSDAAFNSLGVSYEKLASFKMRSGQDPSDAFDRAIAAFDRALQAVHDSYSAYNNRGLARWRLGNWLSSRGENPLEVWKAATHDFQGAIARFPTSSISMTNLANVQLTTALYKMNRGADPGAEIDAAIAAFKKALEANSRNAVALSNLGAAYTIRAEWLIQHGQDPRPSIDQAIEVFLRSAAENPDNPRVYNNLGSAAASEARYEVKAGLDPKASLNSALEYLAQALKLNPNNTTARYNRAAVRRMLAEITTKGGADPMPQLRAARRDLAALIAIDGRSHRARLESAETALVEAQWRYQQGADFRRALDQVLEKARQAAELNREDPRAWVVIARAHQLHASWSSVLRIREIDLGLKAIETGLEINPEMAEAHCVRAALLEQKYRSSGDQDFVAVARKELSEGIRLDPLLKRKYADVAAALAEVESSLSSSSTQAASPGFQ